LYKGEDIVTSEVTVTMKGGGNSTFGIKLTGKFGFVEILGVDTYYVGDFRSYRKINTYEAVTTAMKMLDDREELTIHEEEDSMFRMRWTFKSPSCEDELNIIGSLIRY